MQNGKVLIYGEVLKHEKPFKAVHIYTDVGLSRQLVNYHLQVMVEAGLVQKDGVYYTVKDKVALIDELMSSETTKHELLNDQPQFLIDRKRLNDIVEFNVFARCAKLPAFSNQQSAINLEIDKAISALKQLKRYLNGKQYGDTAVQDWIDETGMAGVWKKLKASCLEEGISEEKFEELLLARGIE